MEAKRRRFLSIAFTTFRDFAENTSIHGIKYVVKPGVVIYERIFWGLIVLSGFCGAGYMTVLFWNRYTSNPTITSTLTAYAPTTAVPFPAVTICNINRVMLDQAQSFIKKLKIKESDVDIVERAFPQLSALTTTSYKNYNMTELLILDKVLDENGYHNISEVLQFIAQPCEDMLITCIWQFKNVSCMQFFRQVVTTDGYCCAFNYIQEYRNDSRSAFYNPFAGFNSGLKILLDSEVQAIQYSSLRSTGLKVLVHNPYHYPGSGSIYKIVSTGRQSYLQVSASKILCSGTIKHMAIEQRQCVYSDEVKLKYFKHYSDTNCLTECEAQYLYRKCGCVPFYYPFTAHKICNITNVPCLYKSVETLFNITRSCNCPSQCEDLFYNVLSSTARLAQQNARPTSSFLQHPNMTDNIVALFVYFSGDKQVILSKDLITSSTYLLSSFGGIYSLFLGCSFITVIEILYYCFFRLPLNMKLIGRIDKAHDNQPKRQRKREENRHDESANRIWTYERNIFLN